MDKLTRTPRLRPIAAFCASLFFAAGSSYAQEEVLAQEQKPVETQSASNPADQAADDGIETVVITGIRHGIETSVAAKRNSDSIIEAVSAEDIGKLPDASIADSIARLPGVTAQRIDGRPSAISIRGLGPDYGGAVLNGREVVSSGDGRAAEYDQFPSELVNQVLVYKTPDAALVGQGLSGTIDIRPVMPLDLRTRQISVNVRGEQNSHGKLSSNGNGALGNRVSASYVNQFADNTIGVALGFAHLDNPGQEKKYEAWRYGDYVSTWGAGATGVPLVGAGPDRAQFAQGFEASVTSSKQVRDGLMAVVEFKPNSDLHSTVDLYYSKFEQDRVGHHWVGDIGLWSGGAQFSNVGTSVVDGNTIISNGTVAGGKSLVYDKTFNRTDNILSMGWKNELKLADVWTAVADVGYSRAKRNEEYIQTVGRALDVATFNFSGLDGSGNQSWSTNQNLADPANVVLTNNPNWAEMRTPHYKDEIKSLRLSGKRDLEVAMFSGIETGVNFTQRDKTVQSDAFSLTLASPDVAVPANAQLSPVGIKVGGINTNVLSWNVPGVMGLYTIAPKDPWSAKDNKYGVHEKVTTAYAKLDVDSELGSIPVRGNIGIQAVHTQQNSDGFAWNDAASGGPAGGAVIPVSGGTAYNDFLPSMNLAFNLQPSLIARLGVAKTMARPRMDDMRAGADQPKLVANSTSPTETFGHWEAGNGGKPDLQPWRATALDMSLEKYIGKRSYVAGAAFAKKLDSFIYQQSTVRDFSGFTNYSTTLTPGCPTSNPGCDPNLGTISTQDNGTGGKVWGIELAAALEGELLTSALKGFGVVVSESATRNSLPKDNNGNTIYLDGFSGIVNNLTFYYEDHGFSARISQRYRSPFTATTRSVLLNTESNTHIDAEKQLDFQMGYVFEEGPYKDLSILFQINNLTNAPAVQTRGPEVVGAAGNSKGLLPWKYSEFGRSFLLGISFKM